MAQSLGGIAGEIGAPRGGPPARVETGGRRMTSETAAANANYGTTASGSSFYAAMRILPRDQREAMFQIYSFCRQVDDIADSDGPRPERLAALQQWRDDIDALYQGHPPARLQDYVASVRTFGLKREDFLAIVDGMEMDVPQDIRAPDLATLDLYCDRVASAVGRLSVRVFGLPEHDGIELAHHLGRALQLTNILRDIDEDATLGRLYLPREALLHAGITSNDPQKVIAERALAESLPAARRAGESVFREGRRDHEAQFAAQGARAPDHVEILSRDPRSVAGAGICRPARAGPRQQDGEDRHPSPLRDHLMQKTAHIIGAGISGLSAAVRLANANYKVHVHEATQTTGGRCRSYFDAATNLMIDNGNHLLLSGNSHALAYARSIGTEAGLVGPKRAQFPFVDVSTGQRWQLDLGDGRLPLWVFDEARRVPDTGLARLSGTDAADLGRDRQTGRQGDPLRGHAVPAAGAAAAAGRAQCRSARGLGGARRRDRPRNAAGGRTGLPAADRARRA